MVDCQSLTHALLEFRLSLFRGLNWILGYYMFGSLRIKIQTPHPYCFNRNNFHGFVLSGASREGTLKSLFPILTYIPGVTSLPILRLLNSLVRLPTCLSQSSTLQGSGQESDRGACGYRSPKDLCQCFEGRISQRQCQQILLGQDGSEGAGHSQGKPLGCPAWL